jgi:phenylalanyl-tRNA synthetase alpha chain
MSLGFEKDKKLNIKIKGDWFDETIPGQTPSFGHLHPLTLVRMKSQDIFQTMGFYTVDGPEIENEWYNFDALNIPKDHPARDMWDTFWLRNVRSQELKGKYRLLLRTHTSPLQIRFMEKNNPPFRIIAPGRVFRHEATDASHEINFYQLEGLMVDKYVSVSNFKAVIEGFFSIFFNKRIKIRLRPSYFPFVEPGFEIDISCINCLGKGCSSCKKTGWVEVMGAGMVHPLVFKNVGLNPKFWQGFAFGIGLDRLAMMKYKIDDVRLFYSGDLRFLYQF